MIVDLQVTADHLAANVRNQLRTRPVCLTQEQKLGQDTVLLDHVEITDRTTLRATPRTVTVVGQGNVPVDLAGSAVEVTQEVVLHLVTVNGLLAAGTSPAAQMTSLPVDVRFTLALTVVGGTPRLQVTYVPPIDVGGLAQLIPGVGQQVDAALTTLSGTVPLDVRGLDRLLLRSLPPVNAGLALDAGERLVTVRLEALTSPRTVTLWQELYAGAAPDRLDGHGWAAFIDETLLALTTLELANAAKPTVGTFGAPVASWSPSGRGIRVSRSGTVKDVGPFDEDADVTVTMTLEFSVVSPDVLRLRLDLDVATDLGGLSGLMGDILGLEPDLDAVLPTVNGWTKVGATTYERTIYPGLSSPLLGHLVVDDLVPDRHGLHLTGHVAPLRPLTPAGLTVEPARFTWQLTGSCSRGIGIRNVGTVTLTGTGSAPLHLCEARVLFDPAKQFPLTVVRDEDGTATAVRIEVGELTEEYLSAPAYPCVVLIKTNGGARAVPLGIPAQASEEELRALTRARWAAVGSCYQLVDMLTDPVFWIPDPPDRTSLHRWDVVMAGLSYGEEVVMIDSDGQRVATGVAGATGTVHLSAVVTPGPEGRDVVLSRSRAEAPATGAQPLVVDVRQTLLEGVASVPADEGLLALRPGRHLGAPVMILVGPTESTLLGLHDPARPEPLATLPTGPRLVAFADGTHPTAALRSNLDLPDGLAASWNRRRGEVTLFAPTATATGPDRVTVLVDPRG
ncbi:hypothetical protein J1G43_17745 [Cellulomonas sp. zg-ZUI22]|uniref:hypothetical protein n=1 Tax=Cellulomonas sp. zg-ZUI22 TaxID=2816955 RepID=UPI001A94BA4D|nr:hypothetical protein [Cellulomonas sp. zg-ZUI22]MBO0901807.1 hypothetical protein [Cellulomonas sp. zg-ZUI22]